MDALVDATGELRGEWAESDMLPGADTGLPQLEGPYEVLILPITEY